MNRTQTLTIALLVAVLPFTSAAFASDREDNERRHGRGDGHERHERYHEREGHERHHERYDHEDRGYYGHHSRHQRRHYNNYDQGYSRHGRWEDNRTSVVLPFPPLPPFPVIILNKGHHGSH